MPGAQGAEGGAVARTRPPRSIDNIDPEDPEYIKDLQRPAAIKEDMNEMERRQRVRQILESKSFRHELEQLITHEKQHGNNPDSLKALEQLSELILPKPQMATGPLGNISPHAVIPIADLKGPAAAEKYTKMERLLRNKHASLFRLIDFFQWCTQGLQNHATLRISQDTDHVLTNPHGLLYHEVTASSLLKIDFEGNIADPGSSGLGLNEAEYLLHSTIHQSRPDIRCIIHLHIPVVGAVAAMKCGLLPISREAMVVGPVSFCDYEAGQKWDDSLRDKLIHDLGPNNKVIFLPNNGFVVGGESVEEAFHLTSNLITACEAQVRAARVGIENLNIPSEAAQKRAYEAARLGAATHRPGSNPTEKGTIKWRMGELEWEAWMRVLDNAGFRAGHLYRQPLFKSKVAPPQSDVEAPPAITAYGSLDESGEPLSPHKLAAMRAAQEKVRWLNSPNSYQKVEIQESGSVEPRTITKWVQDTSPSHSNPVKIESAHMFTPLSENPKEFKEKQREIKQARRAEVLSSGPTSHYLEGETWDEANKLQDARISGTGDHMIVVGAASRGVIQREHQDNAQMYRQLYQPNPFASETDEEIAAYKRAVTKAVENAVDDHHHHREHTEAGVVEEVAVGEQNGRVVPPVGSPPRDARDGRAAVIQQSSVVSSGPQSPVSESCSLMQIATNKSGGASDERLAASASNMDNRSDSRNTVDRPNEPVREERSTVSDDETTGASDGGSPRKKDKKKKFKTPSFLKRKKKPEE